MSFCRFPFTENKRMKNRALIVSVENFYPDADLNKRNGVKRDTQRLHKILTKLGFSVEIRIDIEAEEIYEAFKAESEKTVKDSFVGIISTHGEEGVVFGADGCAVKLAKIYSYFGGPSMADKSKLFLIQACRGYKADGGVEVETDSSSSKEEDGMSELFSIPIDTAVMYATSPGYGAFMHPLGSVLIQTLCDLLEKEGGPDLEITKLLTRLNYQVAYNFQSRGKKLGGKKQMLCFVTRFTREVFPFMDSRTAAAEDLSLTFAATKLISAEDHLTETDCKESDGGNIYLR
ncbi:caspase-7 isoform X3 [Ctenopharyngodon idella]|uniref:caspase-7 isoform X3 n=2 Tax=Ctenopharyngodon idella TaxID=7959 RepID=UPI0022317A23|nr:caspase-7 isoform X3 [Ctenopharyngodon idella]